MKEPSTSEGEVKAWPTWHAIHGLLDGKIPPPRLLGVRMRLLHLAASPGRWSGEVIFERGATNSLGTTHGGFLASILDIAMGYASVTLLAAGERQTTMEMKINFLRGVPPDRLLAEGEVLRRGGRTAYCEASLKTPDGELIARGSGTFSIRRRKAES